MQTELAKARLAGGIGAIIDPSQRADATRQLDAADKEAANTFTDSQRLKQTVQMALGGNKVAPTTETIQELRSIVNRVNETELKSIGGAGNAWDRVKGWLGGKVEGQPIPDNIQKDFLAVADAQQKLAQQKLALNYGSVNSRHNSDIKVPDIAGLYSQAAPSATGKKSLDDIFK